MLGERKSPPAAAGLPDMPSVSRPNPILSLTHMLVYPPTHPRDCHSLHSRRPSLSHTRTVSPEESERTPRRSPPPAGLGGGDCPPLEAAGLPVRASHSAPGPPVTVRVTVRLGLGLTVTSRSRDSASRLRLPSSPPSSCSPPSSFRIASRSARAASRVAALNSA